ncbi:unnamed protein product [Rhodiola kirilowii]
MKFFRIILHPISRKSKLDLPGTFLTRCMESNSPSSVTLKVPGGRKWRVELKRKHDKVWLRHGWPEFATCLELQPGSFLVFDYQEKECVFLVEVFDSTTCEINYATAGDDEDVWLVETTAAVHEPPLKRPKVEEMMDGENNADDVWMIEQNGPTLRPIKSNTNRRVFSLGRRQLVNERPLQLTVQPWRLERASLETKRAFQRAQSLRIQGPYVTVLMHKTSVGASRNELGLPAKFIRTYFNLANNNVMMKVDEKGTSTTWSSVYSVRKPCRASVSGGWEKLAIHKKLQVGDICLFELLERLENSLKVHIFRASKRR